MRPRRPIEQHSEEPLPQGGGFPAFDPMVNQDLTDADLWGDGEFDGNSYDMLKAVYKSPRAPAALRWEAAKLCLKYERPALSAVAVVHPDQSKDPLRDLMKVINGSNRGLPTRDLLKDLEEDDEPLLADQQPLQSQG
jgi:hypothetical protein